MDAKDVERVQVADCLRSVGATDLADRVLRGEVPLVEDPGEGWTATVPRAFIGMALVTSYAMPSAHTRFLAAGWAFRSETLQFELLVASSPKAGAVYDRATWAGVVYEKLKDACALQGFDKAVKIHAQRLDGAHRYGAALWAQLLWQLVTIGPEGCAVPREYQNP